MNEFRMECAFVRWGEGRGGGLIAASVAKGKGLRVSFKVEYLIRRTPYPF